MNDVDEFDFEAMQAQGNNAGVPVLYAMIMTPLVPPSSPGADRNPGNPTALEEHYAYMHRLIEQGKILLIGPCMSEPTIPGQAPVPPGIGILSVGSLEEAQEIARNEPFHKMGWRHNAVMAWTPKFGTLTGVLRDMATQGR